MNTRRTDAARIAFMLSAAAALFIICGPQFVHAQDVTQARTSQDIMRRRAIDIELRDRIRAVTRPTEIIPDPDVVEKRQKEEWVNQLKQDYKRIQVLNNSLRAAAFSTSADYKAISTLAVEMRKRAQRLITNLALPEVNEAGRAEQQIPTDAQVKVLAALIDAHVVSFISSPLFKEMSAVDIEMSTKASHDLKDIMSLSESLKRKAESLGKASQKPD